MEKIRGSSSFAQVQYHCYRRLCRPCCLRKLGRPLGLTDIPHLKCPKRLLHMFFLVLSNSLQYYFIIIAYFHSFFLGRTFHHPPFALVLKESQALDFVERVARENKSSKAMVFA